MFQSRVRATERKQELVCGIHGAQITGSTDLRKRNKGISRPVVYSDVHVLRKFKNLSFCGKDTGVLTFRIGRLRLILSGQGGQWLEWHFDVVVYWGSGGRRGGGMLNWMDRRNICSRRVPSIAGFL